jgi:hypothetical protein
MSDLDMVNDFNDDIFGLFRCLMTQGQDQINPESG